MKLEISKKIINHFLVYSQASLEVPDFRINCKEHKQLLKELDHVNNLNNVQKSGRISYFHGVKLILVTEVEEYSI